MTLTARLATRPPAPIHGTDCSVGRVHRALPDDERAALDAMLYDLGWNASQIHQALREEGHMVSLQQVNRHRRGVCRCAKDTPQMMAA